MATLSHPALPSSERPADPSPRIVAIPLDVIFDGDRLRDVEPAWVATLAASFDNGGEPPPIVVRRPEADEGIEHEFALVIGGHRVAAFRQLGRPTILAEIRTISRLQARLAEIEENLYRHELNPLDRGLFFREHKRVWNELYPEAAHGGDRKSQKSKDKIKWQGLPLDPKRFTADAAERTGMSERTIRSAIALVEALTPETITLLRGTAIARNAAELQRIAAEPADRQLEISRLLRDGKAETVAKAKIASGTAPTGEGDLQEDLFRRICSIWERLDAKNRKRFAEHADLMEPTANYLRAHGRGRS